MLDNQRVTMTAFAILVVFKRLEHLNSDKARTICSTTASHTSDLAAGPTADVNVTLSLVVKM